VISSSSSMSSLTPSDESSDGIEWIGDFQGEEDSDVEWVQNYSPPSNFFNLTLYNFDFL
jgi:hypothetical protein